MVQVSLQSDFLDAYLQFEIRFSDVELKQLAEQKPELSKHFGDAVHQALKEKGLSASTRGDYKYEDFADFQHYMDSTLGGVIKMAVQPGDYKKDKKYYEGALRTAIKTLVSQDFSLNEDAATGNKDAAEVYRRDLQMDRQNHRPGIDVEFHEQLPDGEKSLSVSVGRPLTEKWLIRHDKSFMDALKLDFEQLQSQDLVFVNIEGVDKRLNLSAANTKREPIDIGRLKIDEITVACLDAPKRTFLPDEPVSEAFLDAYAKARRLPGIVLESSFDPVYGGEIRFSAVMEREYANVLLGEISNITQYEIPKLEEITPSQPVPSPLAKEQAGKAGVSR